MARRRILVALLVSLSARCTTSSPQAKAANPEGTSPMSPVDPVHPVDPAGLIVTAGTLTRIDGARFLIRDPAVRAELGTQPRSVAEIEFVYRGPSKDAAPLASGELRRQIGLKLRSRDTCNVVYAMWHIEPSSGLEVSVKSNPTQSTHAQCGDRGYVFVKPLASREMPRILPGQRHTLRAVIRGRSLEVTADGVLGWAGDLPPQAFAFDGPIGLRSDNGEFDVQLRAGPP